MPDYRVKGTDLSSIADAIRTKGGTSADLSFPDGFVSAVQNIPSGGGSTLITKNISANGTYNASSDSADGYSSVTVAVPSLLVTGTFQGQSTDKGTAITVNIPYLGNGFPIACMIYATGGSYKPDSPIASLAQANAVLYYASAKNDISATPDYSSDSSENKSEMMVLYLSGSGTSVSRGHQTRNYRNDDASSSQTNVVRFKSNTTMSVFIANESVGFPDGIEFTYQMIYSA